MREYSFTRQLLLPEAMLSDILETSSTEFSGQQVDFYLPQAKIVIEIDGESHSSDNQSRKDKVRDDALDLAGIKVVRIPSYDIKNNSNKLKLIMETVYSYINNSSEI